MTRITLQSEENNYIYIYIYIYSITIYDHPNYGTQGFNQFIIRYKILGQASTLLPSNTYSLQQLNKNVWPVYIYAKHHWVSIHASDHVLYTSSGLVTLECFLHCDDSAVMWSAIYSIPILKGFVLSNNFYLSLATHTMQTSKTASTIVLAHKKMLLCPQTL